MKQTVFETKQRADELIQRAIEIWRKSDKSDMLEGIENDPVLSMLMTALAYQANETENNLEQMKADIVDEFARMLTPYEVGHAIPATAVVTTRPAKNMPEATLDHRNTFTLGDGEVGFMPLLSTRVLNASVKSVTRLDSRRWSVVINFLAPVADLGGFCFAVLNQNYRDLAVSIDGQRLPLVKPWDFADLPLSPSFDIDAMLYNESQTYMPTQIGLDLFARQNVRLYCIQAAKGVKYIPMETDSLELVFEFTGINEDFSLSSQNLVLNTVVLVNAQQQTVTLSSANPIARVAGYDIHTAENTIYGRQFLHMLRPSEDQIYGETPVEVRRMSADRFNQGALVRLLNYLINKFNSDYYAFLDIQEVANDKLINVLIDILSRLQAAAKQDSARSISGVYLMLRPSAGLQNQPISMEVTYLTTAGASINNLLSDDMMFTAPSGFESGGTRLIAPPTPGFDELHDEKAKASLRRYYMTTHDRLVTPADIKLFCYHELLCRYGIVRDMVKSISVYHRQEYEKRLSGYEILVEIVLIENTFVKRGFADKIQQTEILLKGMMNVRSTNIYPIQVIIRLEPE